MGFIKFLGTAGARFVMIKQLRSSAGIWINYKNTNIYLDPGPGAIVRCASSKPKLDPAKLDAIIITHKHIDHSNDINVMSEAMTNGGFTRRGIILAPKDAMGKKGVIFDYIKNYVNETVVLKKGRYNIGDISFNIPARNIHPVETYGIKFFLGKDTVSFVSDTRYHNNLAKLYAASTLLILNTVFMEKREGIDHLSLREAVEIIKIVKPRKTILTHFGMSMIKAKPYILENKLKNELGMDIVMARDGMTIDIPLH